MEGISRKDLDTAVTVLREKGMNDVADKIEKYDIIPKLYVYSYFKSVKTQLDQLKGDNKKIEPEELKDVIENVTKLQLDFLADSHISSNVKKLYTFLEQGFTREGQFCDFDDSKFHATKRHGQCECESHDEDDQQEYELSAVYMPDESTHKWDDEPSWWCDNCSSDCDSCEFDVSCDMDVD